MRPFHPETNGCSVGHVCAALINHCLVCDDYFCRRSSLSFMMFDKFVVLPVQLLPLVPKVLHAFVL